jgi:hypothetical protein
MSPRPMHYTKKLIYCGTQHNELLPVYITTIIQIHSKWGDGAFGGMAPHQATCLEDDPNSYDQSLLKENLAKHHWMGLWWCKSFQHSLKNICGLKIVCIQSQYIKGTPEFMSQNLWIQHLARISLPWWYSIPEFFQVLIGISVSCFNVRTSRHIPLIKHINNKSRLCNGFDLM